jgi:hypothetical protein
MVENGGSAAQDGAAGPFRAKEQDCANWLHLIGFRNRFGSQSTLARLVVRRCGLGALALTIRLSWL